MPPKINKQRDQSLTESTSFWWHLKNTVLSWLGVYEEHVTKEQHPVFKSGPGPLSTSCHVIFLFHATFSLMMKEVTPKLRQKLYTKRLHSHWTLLLKLQSVLPFIREEHNNLHDCVCLCAWDNWHLCGGIHSLFVPPTRIHCPPLTVQKWTVKQDRDQD